MSIEPIEVVTVECPYCGESFDTMVDTSYSPQEYIEDCQICCAPIVFRVTIEAEAVQLMAIRDNE